MQMVESQFSDDGLWWWDGTRWSPTISEDGRWRWDGQQWVPHHALPMASAQAPLMTTAQPMPAGAARYRLRLRRHTGLLLAWQQSSRMYEGTYEQLRAAYRDAQTYCLLAGWWSLLSVLAMNWIALYRNHAAMKQLNQLAGRSG
jgi:hypothetical protein